MAPDPKSRIDGASVPKYGSANDFDVAIIGGGPAGGAMGAYLGKAGVRCIVLERALFPRPHVGESLVPSSTRVFLELDFLKKMEEAKFPKKYGAIWTSALTKSKRAYEHQWEGLQPGDLAGLRFEERKQEGVDMKYTFHVDRSKFDLMLLQHAQELGAEVHSGVEVTGADFSDPSCARVRYKMGRREHSLTASIVIDASGRNTLLGSQLGWKVRDRVFDQVAVHTWFEGYDRMKLIKKPEHAEYIHVHFLPVKNSWIWQIPITEDITSIGVVSQKKNFAAEGSPEEHFWAMTGSRPEIHEALKAAKQVTPFRSEGDYSYAMKDITGDRVVLIGDAARFVDPIFSTGVSIALNSARFASRDVIAALEAGDCSKHRFDSYATTIRRGTKNWYDFITVYYRLNVLFTAFVEDPRHRLDVLKLLQGDVYDEESPEVLEKMRTMVSQVENDPKHPWHRLLGDLTSNAFSPSPTPDAGS